MVLAAGISTRFPGNKLLAKLCGKSIVRRTVETGLDAGLPTAVVTGNDRELVIAELADLDVEEIYNRRYERGLMSSIKAAVIGLRGRADALEIVPADLPLIPPRIPRMLARIYEGTMPHMAAPVHGGRRGHPVLVDGRIYDYVLAQPDRDIGLREFIGRRKDLLLEVPVDTDAILLDVDTRDDLDRLRGALGCLD